MMIADDQSSRAAVTSADQNGKVFVALAQGMRKCLICEAMLTRQSSAEHAEVTCYLSVHFQQLTRSARFWKAPERE
jgi:hypothetical protein